MTAILKTLPVRFARGQPAVILFVLFECWCLAVAFHMVAEIAWILTNRMEVPPPCGLKWCPHTWALFLSARLTARGARSVKK